MLCRAWGDLAQNVVQPRRNAGRRWTKVAVRSLQRCPAWGRARDRFGTQLLSQEATIVGICDRVACLNQMSGEDAAKIRWRNSGLPAKRRAEGAGIAEADVKPDLRDGPVRLAQQLFGALDPARRQIAVWR